ncbi:hypothetical protein [Fervidibacillus halotolerans]|uniref:Uncharacterized protein n=1 Tax=Fervidibacillus halotolerans TaxID=2980027 RepID=A0A9E8RXR0_9BACI|nr:hypothetical protein [Fervidibacillus halotolerans]WAA12061.1 hypothetical protein OE105_10825 [Fervidibacillus halotolerans]
MNVGKENVAMKTLKETTRYELLVKQFQIKSYSPFLQQLHHSLDRILFYVYTYTNIYFIEFIDEKVLYSYIKYHREKNFAEVSFTEVLKDINNFLYFLKYEKKMTDIPKVDLTMNNMHFWLKL